MGKGNKRFKALAHPKTGFLDTIADGLFFARKIVLIKQIARFAPASLANQFRRRVVADGFGIFQETRAKFLWAFVKEISGVVIGITAPILVWMVEIERAVKI